VIGSDYLNLWMCKWWPEGRFLLAHFSLCEHCI